MPESVEMYLLRVFCVVLSVTVACIDADCPYAARIEKIEPCDNRQPNIFEISHNVSSVLLSGDKCDLIITGCLKLNQEVKFAKCKWTAWKDNMQIHKGEKDTCGFSLGRDLKVQCPMKKGSSICARKERVKSPVGRMLSVAVGQLKIKMECSTETGATQCMVGEGKLFRK